jgi:proteasome lid subunit RPN8/RPN11
MFSQSILRKPVALWMGLDGAPGFFYPVRNRLQSTTSFLMEPMEQLAAMEKIDGLGREIMAIVHSHPTGPRYPSATDLKENNYPGVHHFIWSFNGMDWYLAAFDLENEAYSELQVITGVS